MIYVTGDLHGDVARLKQGDIKKLRRGDTLLVCGDFGFVWDGSKKEQKCLRWLARRRFQILFIEGTHDNLDLLVQYPQEPFCGSRARRLGKHLWYLERGEIYLIEGKRVFAFGGGESLDLDDRIPGASWWPGEMATGAQIAAARENLRLAGDTVDLILTHECSADLHRFLMLQEDNSEHVSPLHAFLDTLTREVRFGRWFFGCYHEDKRISESYMAVYRRAIAVDPCRK